MSGSCVLRWRDFGGAVGSDIHSFDPIRGERHLAWSLPCDSFQNHLNLHRHFTV